MYGGNVSPDNTVLDEMWMLNIASVAWNSKTIELPGIVWERVLISGQTPEGLRGHTALSHPDKQHLMVLGGVRPDGSCSN